MLPRGTFAQRMRFNAGVFVLVRRFFSIGHLRDGTAVTMRILVKMVAQCWKPRQPEPGLQCKAAIVPQPSVGTHHFMRPAIALLHRKKDFHRGSAANAEIGFCMQGGHCPWWHSLGAMPAIRGMRRKGLWCGRLRVGIDRNCSFQGQVSGQVSGPGQVWPDTGQIGFAPSDRRSGTASRRLAKQRLYRSFTKSPYRVHTRGRARAGDASEGCTDRAAAPSAGDAAR